MNRNKEPEWLNYKKNLLRPSKESSSSKEVAVLGLALPIDKEALVLEIGERMVQEIDWIAVVIREQVHMEVDPRAREQVPIIMQEVEQENTDINHQQIDQLLAIWSQQEEIQVQDSLDLVSAQIALLRDSLQEFKEEWELQIIIDHLICEIILSVVANKTIQIQECHQELLDLAHKDNPQDHAFTTTIKYLQIDKQEFQISTEA